MKYSERVLLIYDGLHYDALAVWCFFITFPPFSNIKYVFLILENNEDARNFYKDLSGGKELGQRRILSLLVLDMAHVARLKHMQLLVFAWKTFLPIIL